jgi:hypothetical protein
MAAPERDVNGTPGSIPLPKRAAPRGMLPTTWLNRGLRVEYTGSDGGGRATSGLLLDWCPIGPVLNIRGARTLVSCDRIGILELVE